jgi:predicted O-methyltransferase YrrM
MAIVDNLSQTKKIVIPNLIDALAMPSKPMSWLLKILPKRLSNSELLLLLDFYYKTRIKKEPYFGRLHAANQLQPRRAFYMSGLLAGELKNQRDSYNILEIGSWVGRSTILWASVLQKMCPKGKILCIDPWGIYCEISAEYPKGQTRQRMAEAVRSDSAMKLYLHNIKTSGNSTRVTYIRGYSQDILPLLRDESFDFIYIDGDHSYNGVRSDIRHAKRLAKINGIICGDDLEKQRDELPENTVNPESADYIDPASVDYSANPLSQGIKEPHALECHYGVTMAVWEEFQTHVTAREGFWMTRKYVSEKV